MTPRTPLLDPAGYFADRRTPLARGAAVFTLYVIVGIVSAHVTVSLFLARVEDLPAGVESEVQSIMSTVLFLGAVGMVVAWIVVAAVVHYLSGGSSTDGTFSDALAVAGWAYAPELVTAPVSLLYAYWAVGRLSFDGSDPERLAADVAAAEAQLEMQAFPIVLFLLMTAWSVYILAKGVSETHDVPVETAAIPAVLVGIGSVVLYL